MQLPLTDLFATSSNTVPQLPPVVKEPRSRLLESWWWHSGRDRCGRRPSCRGSLRAPPSTETSSATLAFTLLFLPELPRLRHMLLDQLGCGTFTKKRIPPFPHPKATICLFEPPSRSFNSKLDSSETPWRSGVYTPCFKTCVSCGVCPSYRGGRP